MQKTNSNYFSHLTQAEISPLEVKVENDNFEEAYRRFKKLFQNEKIISKLKEKEHYEKPSERKRRKRREASERRLMLEARERMMNTGEWDKRMKKKQIKRQKRLETKQNTHISEDLL